MKNGRVKLDIVPQPPEYWLSLTATPPNWWHLSMIETRMCSKLYSSVRETKWPKQTKENCPKNKEISETWEAPQFWKKRSRSEKAILGATLGIPGHSRSNSRNGAHDLIYVKTPFSEQLSERLSELVGRQNFSPNSRSVSFKIGVVPAQQKILSKTKRMIVWKGIGKEQREKMKEGKGREEWLKSDFWGPEAPKWPKIALLSQFDSLFVSLWLRLRAQSCTIQWKGELESWAIAISRIIGKPKLTERTEFPFILWGETGIYTNPVFTAMAASFYFPKSMYKHTCCHFLPSENSRLRGQIWYTLTLPTRKYPSRSGGCVKGWGFKNTLFKGISEPQKMPRLKHDY